MRGEPERSSAFGRVRLIRRPKVTTIDAIREQVGRDRGIAPRSALATFWQCRAIPGSINIVSLRRAQAPARVGRSNTQDGRAPRA